MSDKALHLSTTRNKNNLTGRQNFNYIFSTHENINSQWDYIYSKFPALLMYLVEVVDALIFSTLKLEDDLYIERRTTRANYLNAHYKKE